MIDKQVIVWADAHLIYLQTDNEVLQFPVSDPHSLATYLVDRAARADIARFNANERRREYLAKAAEWKAASARKGREIREASDRRVIRARALEAKRKARAKRSNEADAWLKSIGL